MQLDKKNNNYIQISFTSGFVWALNTKGEVYSWAIQKEMNDRNIVIAVKIDPTSQRIIKSLPPKIK